MSVLGRSAPGRLVGRRIDVRARNFVAASPDNGTIAPTSSLAGAVKKRLAGKLADDPGIRFGDGVFYLPKISEVKDILDESSADRRVWMTERFDCDDFAYVLKSEMSIHAYESASLRYALCVGIVWGNFDWVSGYHAVNWFIADDGELRFIEPQSDEIYDISHCSGGISLLLV
jgi:Agglutinin C-terminal